ncbi:hypothetical protein H7J06_10745 [Mycobacterium hodleri]|uniref:hypothetical protein n=1 Tax=Mycolicibacterium hodleri TaxID=49897 RepID=UPI0021F35EA3|nr:hypothetical protein [Mycolicibacterium hodleri]MCV7133460.1 hypothetical protein [Mycolicibacterium hodleri]
MIGTDRTVWSIPRESPGKGGSVRILSGRQLKPDAGRVTLVHGSLRERHSIDDLHAQHWPGRHWPKPQATCRAGHHLLPVEHEVVAGWTGKPAVAYWGTGNRVCLVCNPGWTPTPRTTPPPDHNRGKRHDDDDIDIGFDEFFGMSITTAGVSDPNLHAFPRVSVVPERLRALDDLMRQRP